MVHDPYWISGFSKYSFLLCAGPKELLLQFVWCQFFSLVRPLSGSRIPLPANIPPAAQVYLSIKLQSVHKYCVFSLNFCDFSKLCQFCCTAGFLPAWCLYTQWHRGITESGIFLKIRKNTIFNEHPVHTTYPLYVKHALRWLENELSM